MIDEQDEFEMRVSADECREQRQIDALVAAAVAAEREWCALMANSWAGYFRSFKDADDFAALVRGGPD